MNSLFSKKIFRNFLFLGILFFFFFVSSQTVSAANRYWVGGAGANWNTTASWSTASGGSSGASVPGILDIAIFDSGSNNCQIDMNASVAGVSITVGYSGTITQTSAYSMTVGTSHFSQAGGTYDQNGNAFSTTGNVTVSAGTFTSGSGPMSFTSSGPQTLNAPGITFGIITIAQTHSAASFTVATSTTIDLGTNATSTRAITNNGTINISGIWTVWGLTNNASGVITGSLTQLNVNGLNLVIVAGSTFPANIPVNFISTGPQTLNAPGVTFGKVTITQGHSAASFTVATSTTIDLGTNPTSYSPSGFTNNGTVNVAGVWTTSNLTNGSAGVVGDGVEGLITGLIISRATLNLSVDSTFPSNIPITFTAYTNITMTAPNRVLGTVYISPTDNRATFTLAASTTINLGANATSTCSVTNNGTISVIGTWFINGYLVNNGGATVSGALTRITLTNTLTVASNVTFPDGVALTWGGANGPITIDAPGVTFGTVTLVGGGTCQYATSFIIATTTTINLGTDPTHTGCTATFTNRGTVQVAGNWTYYGSITNSAGATISGALTQLTSNNGNITIASDSTFPDGVVLTWGGGNNTLTIDAPGVTFGTVTLVGGSTGQYPTGFIIATTTTINLGTDPTHIGYTTTFTNRGTVQVAGNWTYYGSITNSAGATISGALTQLTSNNGNITITSDSTFPDGVVLTWGGGNDTLTIDAPGVTFGTVTLVGGSTCMYATDFIIATTTTINLGTDPTHTGCTATFTNRGTVQVAGNWTYYGGITNSAGATISGALTQLTNTSGNLTVTSGSVFPTGVNLNLGVSTVTAPDVTFGTITRNTSGAFTFGSSLAAVNFIQTSTGVVNNPATAMSLTLSGNLTQNANFGGTNLTVIFASTTDQIITQTAGTFSSLISITKTAGTISLATNFVTTGATITFTVPTGATFSLNGKNFTSGGTFTIQDGGTLQLQGNESLTVPVLNTGSTVNYVGNSDGIESNYGLFASDYSNLSAAFVDSTDTLSYNSLLSGLVAYWKLDATSTSTPVADSSGNNNVGTTTGMTTSPSGATTTVPTEIDFLNPGALSFDGTNDYVTVADSVGLRPAQISVSFWVKPTAITTADFILGKTTSTSWNNGYGFDFKARGDNAIGFWVNAYNNTSVATGTVNLEAWNHIVGTYDLNATTLYINGENVSSKVYSTAITHSTGVLEIGRLKSDSANLNGLLDDIRVYNRALSTDEINTLYQGSNLYATSTVTISNDFSLSNGTYVAGLATTTTIGGDFIQTNGVFDANAGTVVLSGSNQTISTTGTTTFANLTKSISDAVSTLTFNTLINPLIITSTTTLGGTTEFPLSLRSSATGTQWLFDPQGVRDFSYLDVQDSYNTNATAIESFTGFVDSGNNTGWSAAVESATLDVGNSGRQTATTSQPVTGLDLGGAFTLLATGGDITVDSIKLKQSGSFSTSSIDNIQLFYKEEATCSASKPSGTTLFGEADPFDANNIATTTGTLALTADVQTCLYITYDVTGEYSTSTLGRSIDFEITNPSADFTIDSGTINTTSPVNISGRTIITTTEITSLLSVKTLDSSKDPTVFYLQNDAVWKKEGNGDPVRLSNPNLVIRSLTFSDLTGNNSAGTVKVEITVSNANLSNDPSFTDVTRTYSTTATVKAWSGNN